MFKTIRTNKLTKFLVYYLSIMLFLQVTSPMSAYALTEGPSQPEFNSFTPIGTSDMVDLASGDFNYNIPIMDVGGYPINLAYNSGVTMDQEASWVGLGWNLNIGQINRNVRGIPDDFKGDEITNENNLKDNITVGVNPYINGSIIGLGDNTSLGAGLNVEYNNYYGITATPSFGVSFKLAENVAVGMQLSSSNTQGATITPNIKLSATSENTASNQKFTYGLSPSLTYNSRQGLSSFNLSSSISYQNGYGNNHGCGVKSLGLSSGSGSISYVNNTFTPSKRLAFKNQSVTFSFSGGADFFGADIEGSITAYGSVQSLRDKFKTERAFGYENTDFAGESDLLDFNREKESGTITRNTLILPVTNYTYDILSIQGQGVGGMIRPFRGQVGYVYDPKVNDISSSISIGLEIEGGAGGHIGGNIKYTDSNTYTGCWNTVATNFLKESNSNGFSDYEKVYYKNIGENRIDQEFSSLFKNKLSSYDAITLKLDGNKNASSNYVKKNQPNNVSLLMPVSAPNSTVATNISNLKRKHRENRNQVIQKITNEEVTKYNLGNIIEPNPNAKKWHTAGYLVTDENGNKNVYGITAYNTTKQEVAFAINKSLDQTEKTKGLVSYNPGVDNSSSNSSGIDHYFNKMITPAYAHTYLLSSVLSPDYVDLTSNGPTDDDLGSYTKFNYTTFNDYKWRVPFNINTASYNEGLKTHINDQKGSYLYGEKELKYATSIVTKTHVAFIDLSDRNDGIGVAGENGGPGNGRMKKITAIRLYSKPEVQFDSNNNPIDPISNSNVFPIKTAHFEYNYSLCKKIDNNSGQPEYLNRDNINSDGGKLTLSKVYFTYGKSSLGKYTPYTFNYDTSNTNVPIDNNGIFENNNPDYNPKNYDIWGNYMPNKAFPNPSSQNSLENTPQEFPYVNQNRDQQGKEKQDLYASAWSLSSIELPSGGIIKLSYESDDYQYVQNKKALQMFKVVGVSSEVDDQPIDNLHGSRYVVVAINPEDANLPDETIRHKYIGELEGKPIYFNFFLNMKDNSKDYVSGYFEMNGDAKTRIVSGERYLYIPMKMIDKEGKSGGTDLENPISVAGWFFGRKNLPYQIYGQNDDAGNTNVTSIAWDILSNLSSVIEIFTGPNGRLKGMGCAKSFEPNKSWVRLQEPSGTKLGGGARIKKIEMYDSWEDMMNVPDTSPDLQRYQKKYGQEYNYQLDNGTSSGVATYEPNVCKENPMVEPFYNGPEKMAAATYEEKPFGESFFPNPTVTYSKVTVKNITAADDDETVETRKTRSGTVVTEHYTSKDFPTKTDFTSLNNPLVNYYESNENEVITHMLQGMLGMKITVNTNLTMSQGFVIETNDMNGKVKKQKVLNNAGDIISSVEYIYSTVEDNPLTPINETDQSNLKSELPVISNDGTITTDSALGLHYDVVNDFRESYANTNVYGVSANFNVIPLFFLPLLTFTALPDRSEHTQILRTAVTTKVIHKTGILKEKIAYDLGSRVSTKNLAWDANTGQVLLTKTANEYDDAYYTLNFPAYWYYDKMGMASQNIDIEGKLTQDTTTPNSFGIANCNTNITRYLKIGDELVVENSDNKLWVTGYSNNNMSVNLMKSDGSMVDTNYFLSYLKNVNFRIIRSGNRNQQLSSMASVTLMKNPLDYIQSGHLNMDLLRFNYNTTPPTPDTVQDDPKIINASAIEYSENWLSQCENGLPSKDGFINGIGSIVNPFLYNIKGQWRAVKSYAYLTGRNTTTTADTRKSGFFKKFNPFYKPQNQTTGSWFIDNSYWTFASQVTQYSPHGVELENRDAINRYSAAQYGYNYKLPVAVSSNSKYNEMGFDGFEDYNKNYLQIPSPSKPHFGFHQSVNANASITDKKSHTGKNSIVVKSNQKATLVKKINGCKTSNSDGVR